MFNLRLFDVTPCVPERLAFLETLSRNLWWSWNADAVDLFRRMNPHLWKECGYNPVLFLNRVPQERLETLAQDGGFLGQLDHVRDSFETDVLSEVADPDRRHDPANADRRAPGAQTPWSGRARRAAAHRRRRRLRRLRLPRRGSDRVAAPARRRGRGSGDGRRTGAGRRR